MYLQFWKSLYVLIRYSTNTEIQLTEESEYILIFHISVFGIQQ